MQAIGFMKYGSPEALENLTLPEIHAAPERCGFGTTPLR
jgi:hypothetical protein